MSQNQEVKLDKTKLDFNENPYKVLTNTIKNPFEVLEIEQTPESIEEQKKLIEEIKKENELPKFYKTEKRILVFKTIFFTIIWVSSFSLLGFILYGLVNKTSWYNPYHFIWISFILLITSLLFLFSCIKLIFFNKDIKRVKNNFQPTEVSNNIKSIYKKLITSFSNINWFSAYIYLVSGFIILLIFIISYFMNVNLGVVKPQFGSLHISTDPNYYLYNLPLITVVTCGSVSGLVLIYQIGLQIFNYIRIKRIETSYSVAILNEEEKCAIKKSVNKRNMILFFVLTIILGFILFIIYIVLRRKRK